MAEPSGVQRNRRRVLDALRRQGPLSRLDLAAQLDLSRATVSKLVSELQADGLAIETRHGGGRLGRAGAGPVGRPAATIALNPEAGAAIGIDFGHGSVRVVLADLAGSVLAEDRRELDVAEDADRAIAAAVAMIEELERRTTVDPDRVVGAGVAVSGPITQAIGELASSTIMPGWAGRRPGEELAQLLGRPVLVGNDADLGAIAEATQGAGAGAADVLYVMLSAGVGAGLILRGQPFQGHRGVTGELGHIVVEPGGRLCRCGNRGCLETVAGAPAVLAAMRDLHGPLTLDAAIALAAAGDAGAQRVFADAGRAVGRVVGAACNLFDPELVVVGGDMSVVGEALVGGVRDGLSTAAMPTLAERATVVAARLGDRAELLGAVGLVLREADVSRIDALAA